ncbi:MAG: subclass B3 metallo-beta-lactamase [Candidatus Sulfotelmatobacter sp.]
MVFFVAAAVAGQSRSAHCNRCREWNRPQAPFRVFGNTYYVGTHGLSSILITSPAGHVLIDGDLPQSVPQIVSHLRSLGFRIEDVRVIVNSHVHFDHAGGIAKLQRLSGARVMASEWSAAVMRRGGVGEGDPQYGVIAPIDRIKNVHELRDGESFAVGDVVITAHLTAGHTPGGTSWTWCSCESGVCRSMVYADSLTPVSADGFKFTSSRVYPSALTDFEKSFSFLETTPCDVLITAHPEFSGLWDRLDARTRGVVPDPMVDPSACRQLAMRGRQQLAERVARERDGASKSTQ